MVCAGSGIKARVYVKNSQEKTARGVSQLTEHLLSKCIGLEFKPKYNSPQEEKKYNIKFKKKAIFSHMRFLLPR
jgi:hypothetical protein